MPKLPLKTVLAYLDDVLEPYALRQVGAQIAEDAELRELVERIRRVVRSRSTVLREELAEELPDAQWIAQYLDGSLPAEAAAELEQRCLESDAVLAEVAACHQLVYSGVLGRSVNIPPQSYERMYRLLRAEHAQKKRAAVVSESAETLATLRPEERILLFGPPSWWSGPWSKRWVPMVLIGVLLVGLVVSLYFALSRPSADRERVAKKSPATESAELKPPREEKPKPTEPAFIREEALDVGRRREVANWLACLSTPLGQGVPCLGCFAVPLLPESAWVAPKEPSAEDASKIPKGESIVVPENLPRDAEFLPKELTPREVAALLGPIRDPAPDKILVATHAVQSVAETLCWLWLDEKRGQLLKPQGRIPAGSQVQVWPGYRTTLRLDTGVTVELVGNVPEIYGDWVLDTSLRLHLAEPPYHLDASLERGWFIITGRKEETLVRLRIAEEIWDLVLPPGNTRVLVNVQRRLQRGGQDQQIISQPFITFYTVHNGVLWRRTRAERVVGLHVVHAVPACALVVPELFAVDRIGWDALPPAPLEPGVLPYESPPAWATPATKLRPELRDALASFQRDILHRALDSPANHLEGVKQGLREAIDSEQPTQQRLAVFGLVACEELGELVGVLERRHQQPHLRQAAREALHYWLGQFPHRTDQLKQRAAQHLGYSAEQQASLIELLRGYRGAGPSVRDRLLGMMLSEKSSALRYLAVANLRELYPLLRDNYSPDANEEARQRAVSAIRKQLSP